MYLKVLLYFFHALQISVRLSSFSTLGQYIRYKSQRIPHLEKILSILYLRKLNLSLRQTEFSTFITFYTRYGQKYSFLSLLHSSHSLKFRLLWVEIRLNSHLFFCPFTQYLRSMGRKSGLTSFVFMPISIYS